MIKRLLPFILVIPLIGSGCARQSETREVPLPAAEPPASSTVGSPVTLPPGRAVVVEYKNGAFTPNEVRIARDTTVTFKNAGPDQVWPASDIHPTHLLCPGFDARRTIAPGGEWSFTFREAKTCPFHNHLSATEIGRIIVE